MTDAATSDATASGCHPTAGPAPKRLVVEYAPAHGGRRRQVFEYQPEEEHWLRRTERWTGAAWVVEGREAVRTLSVEVSGDV